MCEIRFEDFSPAPGEEFALRWHFEFSRDGTRWVSFQECPQVFDIAANYYRIRYWTLSGEEIVTGPGTRALRPQETEG